MLTCIMKSSIVNKNTYKTPSLESRGNILKHGCLTQQKPFFNTSVLPSWRVFKTEVNVEINLVSWKWHQFGFVSVQKEYFPRNTFQNRLFRNILIKSINRQTDRQIDKVVLRGATLLKIYKKNYFFHLSANSYK